MKVWKIAEAYVRGSSHERKGTPCQDRTYAVQDRNMVVVALADGAGSCRFSHIGAEIVTKDVCHYLHKNFESLYREDERFARDQILYYLLSRLDATARRLRITIKDLASTLLFVAVKDSRLISGHIGDGVIGLLQDNEIDILTYPDRGEFTNTTYFVTSSNARGHFRILRGPVDGIQGFILMSDGSADSLYNYQENKFSVASEKMLNWFNDHYPEDVEAALKENLKEILAKKTADDCSICLLRRIETEIEVVRALDYQIMFPF